VEAQLRLKQEQRAKKEAVALFKLEKEQRQQHEAQMKQMLEGQAKVKCVKPVNWLKLQQIIKSALFFLLSI